MNALINVRESTAVCGAMQDLPGCFCFREHGHAGQHMVHTEGHYAITMPDPLALHRQFADVLPRIFTLAIPLQVAQRAVSDRNWRWDPE